MNNYPWRLLIIFAVLCGLILLWIFLPISLGFKLLGSCLVLSVAGVLFYQQLKYKKQLDSSIKDIDFLAPKLDLLPARQRYRLPILLVTGNGAKNFFPDNLTLPESHVIVSAEAAWVYVAEYSQLPIVFDSLVARFPDMLGRIGLFLALVPEQEDKASLFTAKLQSFRQSWVDTCRIAKYSLPVYVSVHLALNNLHYQDEVTLPVYWYRLIDGKIYLLDEYLSPIDNWVNDKVLNSVERQQRLSIQNLLTEYAKWVETSVINVLGDSRQPISSCIATGTVLYPINSQRTANNLISNILEKITTLAPHELRVVQQTVTPPDHLVKLMPLAYPYLPLKRALCHLAIIISLFFLGAVAASYWNNRELITQIKRDVAHYESIASESYDEKYQALNVLKADREQLNTYFIEGVPVRLGFGLYKGPRLLEMLNQAISRYIPKPPEPEKIIVKEKEVVIKEPEVIRLDSLALFESGQSTLKPQSNKILVNALFEIKNQIKANQDTGWLLLISGHTDSTGDDKKNQQLSLERAAAVRDWIIKLSDIPATCFAIQGYGAQRPLVSNDTPEDRAKNRRVEISLVPQLSTCHLIEKN